MRYPKSLTAGLLAASLTGGAVTGALLFTPSLSGAQEEAASDSGEVTRAHHPGRGDVALDVVAQTIGIDEESLRAALGDGQTIAQVAEANGVAVQTVIDALVAEATERITELVNTPLPGPRDGRPFRVGLDVAADTIGITVEQLREALHDGQTLAEVAEANGVSRQALIDALVAAANAAIDEKVAAGALTAEEGEARKAEAAERIAEMVDRSGPPFRGRAHGGRGPAGPAPA